MLKNIYTIKVCKSIKNTISNNPRIIVKIIKVFSEHQSSIILNFLKDYVKKINLNI